MKHKNAKKKSPLGEKCKKCGEEIQEEAKTYLLDIESAKRGLVTIEVPTAVWFCKCVRRHEDGFLSKIHEAECKHEGLISPNDLRSLRGILGDKLGKKQASQQDLADITGIGVATIRRWENGAFVPSGSHEVLLQLLKDDFVREKVLNVDKLRQLSFLHHTEQKDDASIATNKAFEEFHSREEIKKIKEQDVQWKKTLGRQQQGAGPSRSTSDGESSSDSRQPRL